MECPFHKYNSTSNPFYEILWSHRNDLRRVLQFRMTRSNQSCVYDSKGRFSGVLDFGSSVSFLNISTVLMNDTGPYFCYVKIGNSDPTRKMIFLLVRGESGSFFQHRTLVSLRTVLLSSLSGFTKPLGSVSTVELSSVDKGPGHPYEPLFFAGQQPWAAPGDLSYSALQGSKVTLDCDFPTNLTGNFTDLFWLHKRDQSPSRLIAWHLRSSFQVENGSIGSRFQSSLDLENHRSRLTITGLEEKDSGWYQCERGLGEPSGGQRGRGTNLTVKGECVSRDLMGQVKILLCLLAFLCQSLHLIYGFSDRMGVSFLSRTHLTVQGAPHSPCHHPVWGAGGVQVGKSWSCICSTLVPALPEGAGSPKYKLLLWCNGKALQSHRTSVQDAQIYLKHPHNHRSSSARLCACCCRCYL